jgi:hypothetical protein
MTLWNHRVVKQNELYTIREVFFEPGGAPHSWTAEPIHPQGETLEELKKEIERMLQACSEPVLFDNDPI